MAKGKDARVRVILECTSCARKENGVTKEVPGVSRYVTQKNHPILIEKGNIFSGKNLERSPVLPDMLSSTYSCTVKKGNRFYKR